MRVTSVRQFVMGDTFTEVLPLQGFPHGKVRIRVRPDRFVSVYVKTDKAIHQFVVIEQDGFWVPGPELARNVFKPEIQT